MFYNASTTTFKHAKELRDNTTFSENLLWKYLCKSQLGLRFKRQHPIGNRIADFYAHKLKLVIEIDGAVHLKPEQIIIDQEKDELYKSLGLKVLRFTNTEVSRNTERILNELKRLIAEAKLLCH